MGAKRYERLFITTESKKLADLLLKISLAEDYHEETGTEPTTDLEEIYVESEVGATEYGFRLGRKELSYVALYPHVVNLFADFVKKYMLDFANTTMGSNIEYLLVLLDDGQFLVIEGEENKVEIPFPNGLATIHTHPGICLFSHKDLETADHLFSRGYFIVGVMSNSCICLLYRNGVYTIEDKMTLTKFYKDLKRIKDPDKYINSFRSFNSKNLRITILTFL